MRAYKNKNGKWFSGEYRVKQSRLLRDAIERGDVAPPTKCNRCGQEDGVIHTHIEDYDNPLKYEPLCILCHMVHHSSWFAKKECAAYFEHVKEHGPIATFTSSNGIFKYLEDELGIVKRK